MKKFLLFLFLLPAGFIQSQTYNDTGWYEVETTLPNDGLDVVRPVSSFKKQFANVGRVSVPQNNSKSLGSGTYLGDGLLLSCAHLWESWQTTNRSRATVYFQQIEENFQGTLVAINREWDISLIKLDTLPKKIIGVPLSKKNIRIGEKVTFVGYPHGGRLHSQGPAVVSSYASNGRSQYSDWFQARLPVTSGYSGGGVFNQAGHLIGNLWGSDMSSETTAVQCGRVLRFLLPWNARLGAWREGCKNGCVPPGWSYKGNSPPQRPPRSPNEGTPVSPPEKDPPPVVVPPSLPKNPIVTAEHLEKLADIILKRMKDNPELFKGPKGTDSTLPSKLFTLQYLDGDGNIHRSEEIKLGGTLNLPPSRFTIHDRGESFKIAKPLGEPIEIQVTGVLNVTNTQ